MNILIWNVKWAKPGTKRERIIKQIIDSHSPDIICITEGYIQSYLTAIHWADESMKSLLN